jgi:cellulose biosynthesis protein BcsQ
MAACAAQRKLRTAIIDLDPQRSAHHWNESRPAERKLDAVAADPAPESRSRRHRDRDY